MSEYVLRTDRLGRPMWFAGMVAGMYGNVMTLADYIGDAYTYPGRSEANQAASVLGDHFAIAELPERAALREAGDG